jgi:hypothetical protein
MGDILTSCAIIVAMVTWWVTYQQVRRSERILSRGSLLME